MENISTLVCKNVGTRWASRIPRNDVITLGSSSQPLLSSLWTFPECLGDLKSDGDEM
jgi:hypothetical protein